MSICCFCKKEYEGFGNSAWGYWKSVGLTKDENTRKGE